MLGTMNVEEVCAHSSSVGSCGLSASGAMDTLSAKVIEGSGEGLELGEMGSHYEFTGNEYQTTYPAGGALCAPHPRPRPQP